MQPTNQNDNDSFQFSILIPTWNNLPYLKLCISSIKKHSQADHQIIVHINEGSDGTLAWVQQQQLPYTYSATNIGICRALNQMRSLVQTDYIVYLNDDMYVCPKWDSYLWTAIRQTPDHLFFYSTTMLEPQESGNGCVIAPCPFGDNIADFEEQNLLQTFQQYEKADWCGAMFPPNIVHRQLWDEVGGYSIEFSPGMYSDPDFCYKLWQVGVRRFRGIGNSRAYHFGCKSTGRVIKNNGRRQFMRKWGLPASAFCKYYLQLGKPYECSLPNPASQQWALRWARWRAKLQVG